MSTSSKRAVPEGSTVLVTGANGFLGSHVVEQFLRYGYKVRAAVRNPSKESWAVDLFGKLYGKENFELVAVPDFTIEGAYNEFAKGASIIVHVASSVDMNTDPNKVIPPSIAAALNGLKAAYANLSVKRFVLCSSSAAVAGVISGSDAVTENTWNEIAVQEAWSEKPTHTDLQPMVIYEASKKQAEEAVWQFHQENKHKRSDLVVNAVLPNLILGRSLDPVTVGFRSTSGLITALWNNQVTPVHRLLPPQYFIDVEDTALLHVAAAIMPDVQNQRIFGSAERSNWDTVLDVMRLIDPDRTLPENFNGGRLEREIEPRGKAEQLLKALGRQGFKSLEQSVKENLIGA